MTLQRTVALAGNPNSGKTTLFNALTGQRARVGNYPGVTVERREARGQLGTDIDVLFTDLPGCYSLTARSPEEQIAHQALSGAFGKAPDTVVCVVDATSIARGLYLALQIIELGLPVIIALNMMDEAQKLGISIDVDLLQTRLSIPVVPISARNHQGLDTLRTALTTSLRDTSHSKRSDTPPDVAVPSRQTIIDRYHAIDSLLHGIVKSTAKAKRDLNQKLDAWFLHPIFGPAFFTVTMFVLFQAVFAWAEPLIALVETGVGALASGVETVVPPSLTRSLLVHGLIAGVGNIFVFLPQIALLFLGLTVLEESGYLARAAFLMDRMMRRVGLHGKSFVPLMSSFACAVPGIMAARTIESNRDRLVTMMVAPFMSCSARLPVYALVVAAVFATAKPIAGIFSVGGLVITAMYFLGFAAALLTAWLLKRTVLRAPSPPFILEMPSYRLPQASDVMRRAGERCRVFIRQTGTIILCLSVLLWALMAFPRIDPSQVSTDEASLAALQLEKSYAGRIGHTLEPIIKPLGFDWKIGIGLVASFAAREVLVSTLGQVYALGSDVEPDSPLLRDALLADVDPQTQKPRFTPLVGLSLMVFFVLALQCMSTVATMRRETNSWRWPIAQLLYMNSLAYIVSLVVYQTGKALGFA